MATVKKFQGKDRRLILKCQAVIAAIENRDLLAGDLTHKTQALSTRTLILDQSVGAMVTALSTIKTRLIAALLETKPA